MNDEDKTGPAPCENSFKSHIMSKPKQWVLSDQTEKFRVFRYEAPEGSESALWVELRWSLKRELYTAFRCNAVGEGELWIPLAGRSSITPSRSAKPSKRSLGPACPLKRRALADSTYSKSRQANWIIFVFPVFLCHILGRGRRTDEIRTVGPAARPPADIRPPTG